MNKEKIVEELNKLVREIDEDFRIENEPYACGSLILVACGKWICWFSNFDKNDFNINTTPKKDSVECQQVIAKTGIINKFYTKAVELLGNYEPKYTVQVSQSEYGFLYKRDGGLDDLTLNTLDELETYQEGAKFTQSEIKKLKKCNDLAIDWNKAIIKEVK